MIVTVAIMIINHGAMYTLYTDSAMPGFAKSNRIIDLECCILNHAPGCILRTQTSSMHYYSKV
jgi:hypothetical protein